MSLRQLAEKCALAVATFIVVPMTVWGALAIYYSDLRSPPLQTAFAVLFGALGAVTLALLTQRSWRRRALSGFVLVFIGLLIGWSRIASSNDRDWKPEVAVSPHATEEGERVTLHNIRNFQYRSATDFTAAYYDKTFDLPKPAIGGFDRVVLVRSGHRAHFSELRIRRRRLCGDLDRVTRRARCDPLAYRLSP